MYILYTFLYVEETIWGLKPKFYVLTAPILRKKSIQLSDASHRMAFKKMINVNSCKTSKKQHFIGVLMCSQVPLEPSGHCLLILK